MSSKEEPDREHVSYAVMFVVVSPSVAKQCWFAGEPFESLKPLGRTIVKQRCEKTTFVVFKHNYSCLLLLLFVGSDVFASVRRVSQHPLKRQAADVVLHDSLIPEEVGPRTILGLEGCSIWPCLIFLGLKSQANPNHTCCRIVAHVEYQTVVQPEMCQTSEYGHRMGQNKGHWGLDWPDFKIFGIPDPIVVVVVVVVVWCCLRFRSLDHWNSHRQPPNQKKNMNDMNI